MLAASKIDSQPMCSLKDIRKRISKPSSKMTYRVPNLLTVAMASKPSHFKDERKKIATYFKTCN